MIIDEFKTLLSDLRDKFLNEPPMIGGEKFTHGAREYVLDTDLYSQNSLIKFAEKHHPHSKILSEELDNYKEYNSLQESFVVIDPLDGTHNYLYGMPMWGVSYTVFNEKKIAVESYVGIPMLDILLCYKEDKITQFSLEPECAGRRLFPEAIKTALTEKMVAFDNQFYKHPLVMKENFNLLVDNCFTVRITGSSVFDIAMIITGKLSCRIWHNTDLYDIAPVHAFFKQTGSVINIKDGERAIISDRSILVSMDDANYEQLKEIGLAGREISNDK
jgi:myo-inositol-1(or 4)-monophosphatase